MTSPYSGATSVGQTSAETPGVGGNYAVGPESTPHAGNLGTPTTATGQPDIEGVSVGALIGEVTKDLSTLMRQELDLAKAEMKVEAKKAGQGAGMFGAAGLAGLMTVIFLSIALWWALAHLVGHSWSALIVAILWGIVGAVAFTMGKKKFQQVNPKPERTVETLQQVPGALKPNS
jgi:hypothetical protein